MEISPLEALMRKWLTILMLGILLVFPFQALAQGEITLDNAQVQLWPEYDQPNMLVIFEFTPSENTKLPAQVTFHLPEDANVIAAAFYDDGNLLNADYTPGAQEDGQQTLTITIDKTTTYRFEYYQPISFNGRMRQFSYLWDADYTVGVFNIKVQEPVDTVSLTSEPALEKSLENGANVYSSKPVSLAVGSQFTLELQYEKSSDTLTVPASQVRTEPIDETTNGRISLNSYLPYILGGVGGVLIVGGLFYYFLSGRERAQKPRRRSRASSDAEGSASAPHCHQCGTRAKPSDRFCRVCGTRLRQDD
jgi:hypothetical protein